jgi:hypothetical protein
MHGLVYRCFLMQYPFLVDNAGNCALITLVHAVSWPRSLTPPVCFHALPGVSAASPLFIFIMELASLC